VSHDASTAFELLDPRIQQWIWRQGWDRLRDVQEHAIRETLGSDADVLIASATASGKTEAAFLPIASIVAEPAQSSLAVLCVSPLKALINDQHRRLEAFFEPLDVHVHRWHGDVAQSSKQRVLRDPKGVLLITPESLEALFVRQGSRVPGLFGALQFVVIDELHAFIGSERGRQLQSLLHRVELAARRRVRRVALSATLGDMDLAAEFLRSGSGEQVRRIVSTGNRQEVRLQIRGYRSRPPRLGTAEREAAESAGQEVMLEDVIAGDALDVARDIFRQLRGGRHIVFATRRADVELYTDLLRRLSERERVPDEWWPHHGSLDRSLREESESALRSTERPATVLATTTLELGIDVGDVESIGQLGPPSSVASMRQRLGRSGRRGSPAILRIYIREAEIESTTAPHEQLRADLVQAVAMVRLLARRWYEPPSSSALHLSTLVQQVLSLIAQYGGVRADQAWRALCDAGPFRSVRASMFRSLLRDLGSHGLITQTHDGELVLDLSGERLVNHYDFYSAFLSAEEYRLVAGSRTLGTIPVTFPLLEGIFILFGGRRWRVLDVDEERKLVELAPAPGGKAPSFGGTGSVVHNTIRGEMLAVYEEDDQPAFLDAAAWELLAEGREAFARLDLARRRVIPWGGDVLLIPWSGDRIMHTLLLFLASRGLQVSSEGVALMVREATSDAVLGCLEEFVRASPPGEAMARSVRNRHVEKHHGFLGPDLLCSDYASSMLDLEGAREAAAVVLKASD